MRPMMEVVRRKFGRKNLVGAEIGVQRGYHAKSVLRNFSITELVLVDVWNSDISNPKRSGKAIKTVNPGADVHYPMMMKQVGHEPNVVVRRMRSEDACKLYDDEYFDFVYIDASHAYEGVSTDCRCWYPKVKVNGIIGGHDYFDYLGCQEAVQEFIKINALT